MPSPPAPNPTLPQRHDGAAQSARFEADDRIGLRVEVVAASEDRCSDGVRLGAIAKLSRQTTDGMETSNPICECDKLSASRTPSANVQESKQRREAARAAAAAKRAAGCAVL
jgi:hypothetical protein